MLLGLHHITALAGDAQATLDHASQVLKLRLVKRTVNFDDPGTYHFYFGDRLGSPGSLVTFFPGFKREAKRGAGQIVSGLDLSQVMLCENDPEPTARLLGILGFTPAGIEGNRHRFELPDGAARVDILHEPQTERGKMGSGAVHHLAFRVADEAEQLEWRARLIEAGVHVSPVKDRLYFHSIYFREPGGVLFEIATDGPGFLIDEPEEALGSSLCLPPWLEPARESIEARLHHDHRIQLLELRS
ncbi:MAG: ring-cleaving dioxygenase [Acidobacteriia bacterium]|nr:ring-cleaving dioxygenase [Terriglobia bacterium]